MSSNVEKNVLVVLFSIIKTIKYCFLLGKYTNHKGRNRKFTSPEELEEQRKQEELKQKYVHIYFNLNRKLYAIRTVIVSI